MLIRIDRNPGFAGYINTQGIDLSRAILPAGRVYGFSAAPPAPPAPTFPVVVHRQTAGPSQGNPIMIAVNFWAEKLGISPAAFVGIALVAGFVLYRFAFPKGLQIRRRLRKKVRIKFRPRKPRSRPKLAVVRKPSASQVLSADLSSSDLARLIKAGQIRPEQIRAGR